MRKGILTILILILTVTLVFSGDELSKVGTTMAQFLKVGVSGRGTALGDAYVAGVNDPTAMAWNPAGMQQIGKRAFALSHTQLFADITLNYAGLVIPVTPHQSLGISVIYLNSGNIDLTTIEEPEGTGETFTATDAAIGVSYSRRLTERFVLGLTVKYIQEKLYHEKASTFAFDIGSQFDTGIYGMRLGMALQNFGGKMKLDGPDLDMPLTDPETGYENKSGARMQTLEWPIPLLFKMGIMMDLVGKNSEIMKSAKNRFSIALEANDPIDHYLRFNFGAEYEWNGMFALRAGYKLNYDEASFTAGAGFKVNMGGTLLQLDYSFNDYGLLDYVHQYSFAFTF